MKIISPLTFFREKIIKECIKAFKIYEHYKILSFKKTQFIIITDN